LAGVLATFACGALIWLGGVLGLLGATPLAELLVAAILFKFYPEKSAVRWSGKEVVALLSFGSVLAMFWVVVFAWGNTIFSDPSDVSGAALFIGAFSAIVAAPIYEEKVVRHLLLQGLSGLTRPWISAILVSLIFALVHKGAVVWSFIVSIVLCWLALARGVGTLQRAIVHGTINALVMLWYFTSGFGLFR